MKISDFKQKEIRAKISVVRDNNENFVTVKNPLGKKREQLVKALEKLHLETETEYIGLEYTKLLLKELTDLELTTEEDLIEVINNPTTEISLVLHEIDELVNEIMTEFWTSKIRELNQANLALLTTKASKRTEQMLELTRELEHFKNQNDNKKNTSLKIIEKESTKNNEV